MCLQGGFVYLQNAHDHCTPNPCENGAQCHKLETDDYYYCHCPEGWQGKNCSVPRLICDNPPCDYGKLFFFLHLKSVAPKFVIVKTYAVGLKDVGTKLMKIRAFILLKKRSVLSIFISS